MSVVYYVTDGDDILISTMAERAKARAVQRTREAVICVLDEQWPLTYLQVYGPADVEDAPGLTVDVMMKVGQIMSGQPLPEAARPFVEAKAREEQRVVIGLKPQWTVYSPPGTSTLATTGPRCSTASLNAWLGRHEDWRRRWTPNPALEPARIHIALSLRRPSARGSTPGLWAD